MTAVLVDNARIDPDPCHWCGADGQPHSPACPKGERYAQVQGLGGVPMKPLTGDALTAFFRD